MPLIRPELKSLAVDIETITPHPLNPRYGDVDAIAESIKAHGQYRPVIVQESTRHILVGTHTYEALKELGSAKVAATFIDVDNEQAAKIIAIDNRTSDLADYDENLLAEILSEIPTMEGTGWDDKAAGRVLEYVANNKDYVGTKKQITFTCGRYHFYLPADQYREWAAEVYAHEDPEGELMKRLKLDS